MTSLAALSETSGIAGRSVGRYISCGEAVLLSVIGISGAFSAHASGVTSVGKADTFATSVTAVVEFADVTSGGVSLHSFVAVVAVASVVPAVATISLEVMGTCCCTSELVVSASCSTGVTTVAVFASSVTVVVEGNVGTDESVVFAGISIVFATSDVVSVGLVLLGCAAVCFKSELAWSSFRLATVCLHSTFATALVGGATSGTRAGGAENGC